MLRCLIVVPFRNEPSRAIKLPLRSSFRDGKENPNFWSPGPSHRRLTDKGLEFGSPYYYPYSWLSLVNLQSSNIHIKSELAFLDDIGLDHWIGIAVRSQNYMSNKEYLVCLYNNGVIFVNGPNAHDRDYFQDNIGRLSLNLFENGFIPFEIRIDEKTWSVKVGNIEKEIRLTDLPFLYSSGRVMFQTWQCRAILRNVLIEDVMKKGKPS
jgi:hypothetical protein